MNRAFSAVLAATLLAVIGILGNIWDLSEKITARFPFFGPFVWIIEFAFVLFLLLLCVGCFIYLAFSAVRVVGGQFKKKSHFQHFTVEAVLAEDLPVLLQLYKKTANGQMSLDASRALYAHCRKSFTKIRDKRNQKIVGYYVVLPLTENGVKAIKSRAFEATGADPTAWFKKRFAANSAAYIGAIVVDEGCFGARGFALDQLRKHVRSGKFTRAYARAITRDGLRLVRDSGFTPVFPEDGAELGVMFSKELNQN